MSATRVLSNVVSIFVPLILLSTVTGCGANHRWMQTAELPVASSDFEACIRSAASSIPGTSVIGVEYGRFELRIRFQKPLKGVRVYIQPKSKDTADLTFIGDKWLESEDEKEEFASFLRLMSGAISDRCHRAEYHP